LKIWLLNFLFNQKVDQLCSGSVWIQVYTVLFT
jgi:hypothetical protein